jgi:mercuric ion transport protein
MLDRNRSGGRPSEGSGVGAASVSIGAVIAATLGAACCSVPLLGPVIVATLGVSGAATFAGIKPYTPYLFILSFLMLAFSFWTVYRPSKRCVVDAHGQVKYAARQSIKVLLWVATAVWIISVSFTFISLAKS